MKRGGLLLLVMIIVVWGWFNLSWGQCPENQFDNGECDSLNVDCLNCETSESGPYTVIFPMLVTHDLTAPIDSLAGFIIPLFWTHTNPSAYCSASTWWNQTTCDVNSSKIVRSIFRDLPDMINPTIFNRMLEMQRDESERNWDFVALTLNGTSTFWFSTVPTGDADQRWWEGDRVLLATMTMRVQDTMHICIDSVLWPPSSWLSYTRSDGEVYVPRVNLPNCYWVGGPKIQITSPNGGEVWVVGETHDITWISENFSGASVDIEFSTDGGGSWAPIVTNSPNDGVHPWVIPEAVFSECLVRVSDSEDGIPSDEIDNPFSIILTAYFELDVQPDTEWVKQGDSVEYLITLTSLYGFDSPCTLTVAGIPPLSIYNLDPWKVVPTGTSILSVKTDSLTPLGTYPIQIIATEQTKQIIDTIKVILYVTSSINRKPNIIVPGPQNVYAGQQIVFPVYAVDTDTVDTLTLTKSGVGNFPCYPRVSPVVCYFQWTTTSDDTAFSPYTVLFHVDDGRDSTDTDSVEITVLPYDVPPSGRPGDLNGDSMINLADVVFMVNNFFLKGPPPNPPVAGDVNGDCFMGISDLIWLLNYLYRNGPPPQIRCLPGDFNYDGYVDILDPLYFIDYMAYDGSSPVSMKSTDVNTDCFINVVDLVYETKYLLRGGAAPEPGCVEPTAGLVPALPPGTAEVSFNQITSSSTHGVNQMPIWASFDEPVAGVELIVTFDPDQVSLLPPTLTRRTDMMEIFYTLERGKLSLALVDINDFSYIQPGSGPILNLEFVPVIPGFFNPGSIQIQQATFVDMNAQELTETIVR